MLSPPEVLQPFLHLDFDNTTFDAEPQADGCSCQKELPAIHRKEFASANQQTNMRICATNSE
jgi:hypothetical protein